MIECLFFPNNESKQFQCLKDLTKKFVRKKKKDEQREPITKRQKWAEEDLALGVYILQLV